MGNKRSWKTETPTKATDTDPPLTTEQQDTQFMSFCTKNMKFLRIKY